MGWKLLKETFGIKHHVQVSSEGVHIGSGYVSDLATINPKTGAIRENQTFSRFLSANYPGLLNAKPETLVNILNTPDTFLQSITVYTYDGGEIIEKQCETPEWPNVTHDGCMMYENTFSTDKAEVVKWAKRNASLAVHYTGESIERAESELASLRTRLAGFEAEKSKLDTEYPTIVADQE
jgi:hypothetical protein